MPTFKIALHCIKLSHHIMAAPLISLPLPVLPDGWSVEKDFKPIGTLSASSQRNVEPVGPHFLAHARRVRDPWTFVSSRLLIKWDFRSATGAHSLRMSEFRHRKM